eukprot:UN27895
MWIRNKIKKKKSTSPFLRRSQWKYSNKKQVELDKFSSGAIACQIILPDKQRKRVYLCRQHPDWLLLYSHHQGINGYATIELVQQINKQEAFFKKTDNRVIYVILISNVCPAFCCTPVQNQKHKWSLTLYFDGGSNNQSTDVARADALNAMRFFESIEVVLVINIYNF